VEEDIYPFARALHGAAVAQVGLEEDSPIGHVLPNARKKVVEDYDLVTALDQVASDRGSDETGAAGHKSVHQSLRSEPMTM
jgi:hypothetical protein